MDNIDLRSIKSLQDLVIFLIKVASYLLSLYLCIRNLF